MEFDNELLIQAVQERPVLWDKTVEGFNKDRTASRTAWQEVCVQLCSDFDELEENVKEEFCREVMKRWKHLRDAFAKSEKDKAKISGVHKKKKKYIYHDELQFLKKIYDEEGCSIAGTSDRREEGVSSAHPVKTKAVTVIPKLKPPPTRLQQKMDESDIQVLQSFSNHDPDTNRKWAFFESLLPHVEKFDDNQWLQCQMEFLQVISKIKNDVPSALQDHDFYNHSAS